MTLRAVFIAMLAVGGLALPAAADETAPANLANACAGCHGGDGAIPMIDELTSEEIAEMLRLFKNDEVVVTVMNRIAKGYTDEEILAIANYLGGGM
jgi:sulfide dehydrogenase cytochrome subunit